MSQPSYVAEIWELWNVQRAVEQLKDAKDKGGYCIGYMRSILPKLDKSSNVIDLVYTGNPCHRTYVLIRQPYQQSTQANRYLSNDKGPTIEIIYTFREKEMDCKKGFEYYLPLGIKIFSANEKINERNIDMNQFLTAAKNLKLEEYIRDLEGSIPRKIYIVET